MTNLKKLNKKNVKENYCKYKIYPTLSKFIINAYNNDSIILITEKELITLNKYIRETTC